MSRFSRLLLICTLIFSPWSALAHDTHPLAEVEVAVDNQDAPESESIGDKVADFFAGSEFSLYRQNYAVLSRGNDQTSGSDTEVKFQLSFKQSFGTSGLHVAYTQKSFWRFFDAADSRPFRETNYSPELFWRLPERWFDGRDITVDVGFYQHESNGMTEPTSRSWDRSYLRGAWDFGRLDAELKVWHRWSEDVKRFKDDPAGDENPDILDFYGHGELRLGLELPLESYLRVMGRHNFATDKGAVQVDFSLPISKSNVFVYAQLWDGYGESLIDYDRSLTKYAIGLRFVGEGQR